MMVTIDLDDEKKRRLEISRPPTHTSHVLINLIEDGLITGSVKIPAVDLMWAVQLITGMTTHAIRQ